MSNCRLKLPVFCLEWRHLPILGLMCCAIVVAQAATPGATGSAPATVPAPAPAQSPLPEPGVVPEIRFAFSEATLRLPTAQEKGTVNLLISAEATGKDPLPTAMISVVDTAPKDAPAGSPKVVFETIAEQQGAGKTRTWFLQARVEGLPVNSVPLTRTALVTLGTFQRSLTYLVTNKPASPPDFTVVQPAPWSSTKDDIAAALLVSAGEQPLRGLRLAHAALSDKTQSASIPLQALDLCTTASGECLDPPLIPAGSAQTVYLRFKDGQRPLGRFTGTVSLAVDARADAKPVSVEINATCAWAQFGGAVLILGGVFVAFGMSGWSRNRLQRLAALQPVAAARERIERLLLALESVQQATGVTFENTHARFGRMLNEELDESVLDAQGILPKEWAITGTVDTAALQARLKAKEPQIAGLAVMVQEGALVLFTRLKAIADNDPIANDKRECIRKAVAMLDDPNAIATEAEADKLIRKALEASLPPQPFEAMQGAQAADAPSRAPLSVQRIGAEIEALNRATWFVYAILTAVAGTATLILTNPGFGTLLDLVFCLFWGFGMPVTLEKLQQLSPTQISKAVGVSLPA